MTSSSLALYHGAEKRGQAMEKGMRCQVRADCLQCGWVKEGTIEATTEEGLVEEAHKFFKEECASHSCGKSSQWQLQWGSVVIPQA